MIIVAGGCSFIWGSELADSPHGGANGYSKKTFTALLSQGHDYICAAYPGIGNREIGSRVKKSILASTVDIVIVCWTWPSRDGVIDSDDAIIDLQTFLDDQKIAYIFTCADNCIRTNNNDINWKEWFWFPPANNNEQYMTQSPRGFYQWAKENKYPVGTDHHPLEKAHFDAAVLLQGKFNELVKKNSKSYPA